MNTDNHQKGSLSDVYLKTHNYKNHKELPVLVLRLKTCPKDDEKVIKRIKEWFENHPNWVVNKSNCADLAKFALKGTKYYGGLAFVISTPQELAQDIWENNKNEIKTSEITTIKGDLESYGNESGVLGVIDKKVEGLKKYTKTKIITQHANP